MARPDRSGIHRSSRYRIQPRRQHELQRRFNGLQGDVESVGEFIRLYLSRNARWASPLFMAGESYGTTRAADLAGYLIARGIALRPNIPSATWDRIPTFAIITMHYYMAGHMIYLDVRSHKKLKSDIAQFIKDALPTR